eukprot:CAMPEP_0204896966 /NCGR_PEP_ID=MMETSP1397-20131031/473_1 /ASSEMBLY_ACC=CAM_ASM_000891 /TAXON_ID=49980 /ORGANISM="Climacostomum Climacostomum virens, Strain Stock W-24" /LENGTH=853 /DNA_ID=CAMNT_0052064663 /DNA_START=84 /DNA_END=2642 /DNA_ORIENTATION=+
MGQKEVKADPIEELCNLLYQKEATGHSDMRETIKYIKLLKDQLEDPLTSKSVSSKLAEGWGINMLEEWLVISTPSDEEVELMACTTDIFISLLEYPEILKLILAKRLVKSFTTLAFKKPEFGIKGVHMLEKLALNASYQEEMIEQGAIQTFLLLVPSTSQNTNGIAPTVESMPTNTQELIGLSAMSALLNLAKTHQKRILESGSINPLIDMLLKDPQNISSIMLETISRSIQVLSHLCVIDSVRTRLLSAEVIQKITAKLNTPELQWSVCDLISNLCRDEDSRRFMKDKIPQLIQFCAMSTGKLALKAKTCLVCVCFCDENYEWLERKGKLALVREVMLALDLPDIRLEVASTLERLSKEAKTFRQPKLLVAILEPLVMLLDSPEDNVITLTTTAILRLTLRTDMQRHVNELKVDNQNATKKLLRLVKKFLNDPNKDKTMHEYMENAIFILCILTNHFSNSALLVNRSYILTLSKICTEPKVTGLQADMATITLCSVPESFSSNTIKEKLKHALTGTKHNEDNIVLKSVGVLSILAADDRNRVALNRLKGIETIIGLLEHKDAGIAGQAAQAISNLLVGPEGLELWLKLDTLNVCDAASLHVPMRANVGSMIENGINEHWGHSFKKGEVIDIPDMPYLDEWTLSFWFLITPKRTDLQVIVQGHKGVGAILAVIDHVFCIIDETTARIHPLVDLSRYSLKSSWQHFTLRNFEGLKVYLNGIQVYEAGSMPVRFISRMRYFANSSDGNSPFGSIADIRVYKRILKDSEIEALSKKTKNVVDGLPDRMAEYVNLANGVNMLHRIFIKDESQSKLPVIHALANLATKASLRGSIIRSNFLPLIVAEVNSANPSVKFH